MIERLARTILFLGLTIPLASFGQQSVLNYLYTEFNEGKQQQTITTIMNGSMSADAQEELAYAEAETLMIERLVKIDGVASIESSIPLRRIKSGISRTP